MWLWSRSFGARKFTGHFISALLLLVLSFHCSQAGARSLCGTLLDTVQRVFKSAPKRPAPPASVRPDLEQLESRDVPGANVIVYLQFTDLMGNAFPNLPVTATSPITGQVFNVGVTDAQGTVFGEFYDPDIGTQHTEPPIVFYNPANPSPLPGYNTPYVSAAPPVTTTDIPGSYTISTIAEQKSIATGWTGAPGLSTAYVAGSIMVPYYTPADFQVASMQFQQVEQSLYHLDQVFATQILDLYHLPASPQLVDTLASLLLQQQTQQAASHP